MGLTFVLVRYSSLIDEIYMLINNSRRNQKLRSNVIIWQCLNTIKTFWLIDKLRATLGFVGYVFSWTFALVGD